MISDGDPDGVGVASAKPGEVAGILGEPVEQGGDEAGRSIGGDLFRAFQDFRAPE